MKGFVKKWLIGNLLADGRRHTVAEMRLTKKVADPRQVIHQLRKDGVEVLSEWVHAAGTRHKVYWIKHIDNEK